MRTKQPIWKFLREIFWRAFARVCMDQVGHPKHSLGVPGGAVNPAHPFSTNMAKWERSGDNEERQKIPCCYGCLVVFMAEVDAAIRLAETQLVVSDAQIEEAESAYRQAQDELATRTELRARNSPSVAPREIERLQNVVDGRQAAVAGAIANKQTIEAQIASVLPAQQASAEAQVAEAQVDLDKTVVHAGIDGLLEQFTLRKGDVVNPLMRPAGVLIPSEAGRWGLIAGFNQLEAQVIRLAWWPRPLARRCR